MIFPLAVLAALCALNLAHAETQVRDDSGTNLRLAGPARRIVSLAPHITENLFAAGAGNRIVGVVDYSDYPEAALRIAHVGGASSPDIEAIVALHPDLVIAWQSGSSSALVRKLQALGIRVFQSQPDRMEDIPTGIEKLGRLAGTEIVAAKAAARLRLRLAALRRQFAGKTRVPVFYEVWHRPLMTVGGGQIISDVIRVCGGENIFASQIGMAPVVSVEAVLAADPWAIVAGDVGDGKRLDEWRKWPHLKAVARGNLFFVPTDLMQRPTPRLFDGAELLCQQIETARSRRPHR